MAYNSEQFESQAPNPPQGFLRQVLTKGQTFGFSKANNSVAISLAKETKPSSMKTFEKNRDKSIFWNEKTLTCETLSAWSQLYFFIVAMTKGVLLFFLPLGYILLFATAIFGEGGWRPSVPLFYGLTLYGLLPCLFIYGHFKLIGLGHLFLAPFLKSKILFELNKQTGMVTLFKKGNRKRFEHPFIEFDCVLISAPSPQGHLNYNLVLIHRYHEYSVGVPLHNFVGTNQTVSEYHRLWNMIQRYMDVSQPMPDIMILEPAREKDPATAAYDKSTNRDPRYWRDMTDEQFEKEMKQLEEKQRSQPPTGPAINIFSEDAKAIAF
ncbi:hypothetical protein OPW07_07270 [Vibrio europaeus]|uniref:hypothetical protein n=1 Tax=Vibrio europaeus TaxID=300876 RepID=UPI0018A779B1|nr:hypothetical protein [Vibrio europaeus]MDC5809517.1 hypothetical protein [Vibrio europaeus]QPG35245.1 hypothetical protein IXK98_17380 [Vibrio europaeus]